MIKKIFLLTLLLTSTLNARAQFESRNSLEVNFANLSPFGYSVLDERRDLTLSNFSPGPGASVKFYFHLSKSIRLGFSYSYFALNSLDGDPASQQIDGLSFTGHGIGASFKYLFHLNSRFSPFLQASFGAEMNKVSHGELFYELFEPIIDIDNNGEQVFIQRFKVNRSPIDINGINGFINASMGFSYRFTKNTSGQISYGLKSQFFTENFYLESRQNASQLLLGVIFELNRKDFL